MARGITLGFFTGMFWVLAFIFVAIAIEIITGIFT